MEKVRVRFAPSPTGYVHVGSLRTALYNYLFAKHHNGDFVLRVEDTDQSRFIEGAVDNLLNSLQWAGIEFDEGPQKGGKYGPYFQSQRRKIYNGYIEQLLNDSDAYYCFCSSERLEKMREKQIAEKKTPKYDGHCRKSDMYKSKQRAENEPHVIRMKIPEEGATEVNDIIRGKVIYQNEMIDDQVLRKSDGFPTYHLANVVDDYLMKITHVIRGEEWLISTPKHVLLYQYLGWKIPQFAHLPLLLNPDRSKLSKRQGDVAVEDYRAKGYLPQALINFVALLGWNRGDDQEIFSLDDLINDFSLERVNKAGAVFNKEKLDWINGMYIRNMDQELYLKQAVHLMKEAGFDTGDNEQNKSIAAAVKNSLITMNDIKDQVTLFFADNINFNDEEALKWIKKEQSNIIFDQMQTEIEKQPAITLEVFKLVMKEVQQNTGIKGKELWMPVRVAITGMTKGPELPLVIEILGKERILKFLEQAKQT